MRRVVISGLAVAALAFASCGPPKGSHSDEGGFPELAKMPTTMAAPLGSIKHVFVVVMENHDWVDIHHSKSAPYINGTLLTQGAHAEHYTSPEAIHPSEPNYIWLEAGDNLGIRDNDDPAENYRTTRVHLTKQLEDAGISWRSYQEGISGTECPLRWRGKYAPKHNPMVFFDDVTDGRNPQSKKCIEHVRPYEELARDLAEDKVPQYVFVTPDLCHDMHDESGCESKDSVANGDRWLSRELPKIFASRVYKESGAVFVTWDESESDGAPPIGMIVMSPFAKPGYANAIPYTHSSLVRTVQEIFGVRPYMRNAAHAAPLTDLFAKFP